MYITAVKLKFSNLYQENLELKTQQFQKQFPKDSFYFRGYGSTNEKTLYMVEKED